MSAIKRRSQIAILAALAFGALQLAGPASAASASAFCSSGAAPDVPIPVPQDLEADVAKTFDIPVEMVRDGAFVRCAGTRLLACAVGANLNCGKADASRSLPGAREYCRVTRTRSTSRWPRPVTTPSTRGVASADARSPGRNSSPSTATDMMPATGKRSIDKRFPRMRRQ
jgi:hypothetical protein